jgi:hypothetical protein
MLDITPTQARVSFNVVDGLTRTAGPNPLAEFKIDRETLQTIRLTV